MVETELYMLAMFSKLRVSETLQAYCETDRCCSFGWVNRSDAYDSRRKESSSNVARELRQSRNVGSSRFSNCTHAISWLSIHIEYSISEVWFYFIDRLIYF